MFTQKDYDIPAYKTLGAKLNTLQSNQIIKIKKERYIVLARGFSDDGGGIPLPEKGQTGYDCDWAFFSPIRIFLKKETKVLDNCEFDREPYNDMTWDYKTVPVEATHILEANYPGMIPYKKNISTWKLPDIHIAILFRVKVEIKEGTEIPQKVNKGFFQKLFDKNKPQINNIAEKKSAVFYDNKKPIKNINEKDIIIT